MTSWVHGVLSVHASVEAARRYHAPDLMWDRGQDREQERAFSEHIHDNSSQESPCLGTRRVSHWVSRFPC